MKHSTTERNEFFSFFIRSKCKIRTNLMANKYFKIIDINEPIWKVNRKKNFLTGLTLSFVDVSRNIYSLNSETRSVDCFQCPSFFFFSFFILYFQCEWRRWYARGHQMIVRRKQKRKWKKKLKFDSNTSRSTAKSSKVNRNQRKRIEKKRKQIREVAEKKKC